MTDKRLTRLVNDVTRFLVHPGCKVVHPSLEGDMLVVSAGMAGGDLLCLVKDAEGVERTFPFAELYPGGPVSDGVRIFINELFQAAAEDLVAQLRKEGQLRTIDLDTLGAERVPAGAQSETVSSPGAVDADATREAFEIGVHEQAKPDVDHLQVHPEYVMDAGSKSTKPAPEDHAPEGC